MNKLYLFGCSHSEITSGLAEEDFWGDLLAKKLNLQFSPSAGEGKAGTTGCNVNEIFFDLETTLMFYPPDEDDVVIWNTSYMLRKMAKGILIKYKDEIEEGVLKDFWKPDIVCAFHWFTHTKMGYELLRNRKIETYQWLLDGEREIIDLIKLTIDSHLDCNLKFEGFAAATGTTEEALSREFTCPEQRIFEWFTGTSHIVRTREEDPSQINFPNFKEQVKWENLIRVPDNFNCWNDFILKYPVTSHDGHLSADGHHKLADIMYNQINEYRNEK